MLSQHEHIESPAIPKEYTLLTIIIIIIISHAYTFSTILI